MPIANGASILLQDNDKGVTINPPNTYYGNSTVKFAVYGKSYFNNEVGIYEEPQSGKALYIVNPYGDIAIYAQDEVWYQSLHQITKSNDFKSNYGDLPNSLDKILALQTQSFTYQTDKYPNEDLPTDIQYEYSIDEFEKQYSDNKMHPMDVKQAVSEYLVELLEPARKYFQKHEDILQAVEKTFKK